MAEALIKDLSGQVQSNDIESGKKTLTKLKVMANILYCYMILHTSHVMMILYSPLPKNDVHKTLIIDMDA